MSAIALDAEPTMSIRRLRLRHFGPANTFSGRYRPISEPSTVVSRLSAIGGQDVCSALSIVEPGYAILRFVAGFLFAFHGAQKLFGMFDGTARPLASLMGLAGIVEFAGGVLVMIGLLAGLVAFLASGQMAFAYFLAHAPRGGWPIQNDGELAVLFCFVFLLISARGVGIWSVDAALFRRSRSVPSAGAASWSRA